jgi:ABC-type multidrug transport system fused ATPase/permease subunit
MAKEHEGFVERDMMSKDIDSPYFDLEQPGSMELEQLEPRDVNNSQTDPLKRRISSYRRKKSLGSNLLESLDDGAGSFKFKNIEFEVGRGKGKKKILHRISSEVKRGQTLALMGPSGAG